MTFFDDESYYDYATWEAEAVELDLYPELKRVYTYPEASGYQDLCYSTVAALGWD